jgi:HK97 family phage portal protein
MKKLGEIIGDIVSRIPGVRPITKSSPGGPITLTNPHFMMIFGLGGDGDTLNSPYSQIPIVYAAIRAVEKVLSQTPWQILKGEKEQERGDPIFDLFAKPNLRQSPFEVRAAIGSNLQIKGNAYLVRDEKEARGIPLALYAWPASYFTPHFENGRWTGWMVKRGSASPYFLPPERVIHIPTFNPADELMGLAPLDVLKMSYKSLWEALVYNRKFFQNDGTPPIIYKAKDVLPDQYRETFLTDLRRRRGMKHAHEAQLIEAMDAMVIGFTQKDMQFLELVKYHNEDALMVFGVTKTQVSKYEDVNYATALSQDKVFITNTCLPLMRQIEEKINSQFLTALGYTLKFKERANQALTYISSDEATKVVSISTAGLITKNEGRDMLGLEPVPWGDEQPGTPDQLPTFPAPAKMITAQADPAIEKALVDEMAKAQRTNTWHALNARISPTVGKAEFDVRKYFHSIEIRALARVNAKAFGPELTKASDPVFDDLFEDAKLERIVDKYLRASLTLGAGTLDVEINLAAPEVLAYLGNRTQYMKGINADAKAKLRETLESVLQDAMEQQMTEQQRTATITEALKTDFAALKGRARMIARTEVHSAFSDGRFKAAEELDPKEIEWISSRDALVRDSHRALDGKRVAFQEKFSNGCRYPLDPRGEAEEIVNCRCNFQLRF